MWRTKLAEKNCWWGSPSNKYSSYVVFENNGELVHVSKKCTEGVVEVSRGLDLKALKCSMECQMQRNCGPV